MSSKRGSTEIGFFVKHKLWIAICTLIGTTIGAGILGIPYAVAKVGFLYGFILMVVIGLSFLFLNLFLGEVVLRTKQQHQLTGYAGKYLGSVGKKTMTFSFLLSIYGALTAYLIGEGTTLQSIFHSGSPVMYSLLFFLCSFVIVYKGLKATGKAELILTSLLILVVIAIGMISLQNFTIDNFSHQDLSLILLPYGIIIFAFVGSSAIPQLQEELTGEKKKMKTAIIVGSVIPIIVYLLFTVAIMGIVGLDQFELLHPNQRIASIALSIYASPLLGLFANILAVLTMLTSFLTLSLALLEVYNLDYGLSHTTSLVLTFLFPLAASLLNLTTFIGVLEITGTIAGGLIGILIVLMYWKAKQQGERTPEYCLAPHFILGLLLIVMFTAGILYQLKVTLF